jgi:hypothetical protein
VADGFLLPFAEAGPWKARAETQKIKGTSHVVDHASLP